jgi:hypothetical protein
MSPDISDKVLRELLNEKFKLFDQFIEWGWNGSAYAMAQDITTLEPDNLPKDLAGSYKVIEAYRVGYQEGMLNSGSARLI